MALTFNGTAVSINPDLLPSGYTKPTVTTFADAEYTTLNYKVDVLKTTVANADPVVTMTNILNNATIGVNKQVEDKLNAELDVTNTIDAFATLTRLETNQKLGDDFYNDTACYYRCYVSVKFKYA